MIHMFHVLLIHIVMDIFEIMISMIKHILYVIIIMLIYGIKIIWKMPIFLTARTTSLGLHRYLLLQLNITPFLLLIAAFPCVLGLVQVPISSTPRSGLHRCRLAVLVALHVFNPLC
jgi:hypothetical protein